MVKVPIKRGRATKLSENFRVSLRSIAGTKLRSTLTIAIIAIGITSLVGILTTTEAITGVMKSSFGKMGSLSFSLTSLRSLPPLNMGRRINKRAIKYNQAQLFTESFESSSLVTIYTRAAVNIALESENATSNPTFSIWAVDENYLQFMAISIAQGRYFNSNDFERGLSYAVVGANVAKALFKRGEALGSIVRYGSFKFRIIGVLEPIGETFGGSVDSQVWLTIPYARATLLRDIAGYSIGIQPNDNSEDAMVEAEQLLRSIRRLRPTDKTDFRIVKANAFLEDLEGVLSYVTIAAFIVGVITLLGATVGLMNIMLVSVKERSREIGTRKALGATNRAIGRQFLFESITLGVSGGVIGIIFGVTIGNLVASLFAGSPHFTMPWLWIASGVALSLGVSILSGYIPAKRASNLDPIVALRQQ